LTWSETFSENANETCSSTWSGHETSNGYGSCFPIWSESASENGDETWNEIAISRKTWSAMNGVWIHDERLCLQRA